MCSLTGPRVLLNGSEDSDGDGLGGGRMECTDPIDCLQKCRYLERTSRHGFGAPPACALCNQYCSSNLITTVMELKDAFKDDLFTIGRLITGCFMNHGLGGCICQFALTLQPKWRQVADPTTDAGKMIRCENGDPFELILIRINSEIIDWLERELKNLAVGANDVLRWILFGARPIPEDFCFDDPARPWKCKKPFSWDQKGHWDACEDVSGGLDQLCYYRRVRPPALVTHIPYIPAVLHPIDVLFTGAPNLHKRRFPGRLPSLV